MGDVRQLDGPPITCNYVEIKSKGFTGSTWLFIQCSLLEVLYRIKVIVEDTDPCHPKSLNRCKHLTYFNQQFVNYL